MTVGLSDKPLPESESGKPESEKTTISAPAADSDLEENSQVVRAALKAAQKPEPEKNKFLTLAPGAKVTLRSTDFSLKRPLEIFDEKGKFFAKIARNLNGNKDEDRSFTLTLSEGQKVLIPVPYLYFLSPLCIHTIRRRDTPDQIVLENMERPQDPESESVQYHFGLPAIQSHHIEKEWIQKKAISRELPPAYEEVQLEDENFLVFAAGETVLKQIYKVPGSREYILRDAQGKALGHYLEGGSYENEQDFQFKIENGKFLVKGSRSIHFLLKPQPVLQKVEEGCDASFSGTLYGGREVFTASYREVGRVKLGYTLRNEDNAGFNQNTAVVCDGIGGNLFGAQISSFGVGSLLKEKGTIHQVLSGVHENSKNFTRCFRQEGNEDQNAWPPPDTVLVVARFEGNKLRTAVLGDSKVYVIRGDSIVYETQEQSYLQEQVRMNRMTKRQAMEAYDKKGIVTRTLVTSFYPHYDAFDLQPGDMIILCSDGAIMPEEDLIECVKNQTAATAGKRLLEQKREENLNRGAFYPVGDGKQPGKIMMETSDNTSYIVVRWD